MALLVARATDTANLIGLGGIFVFARYGGARRQLHPISQIDYKDVAILYSPLVSSVRICNLD